MRPTGQNQFGRSKKSKAFFVLQASIKYEREVLKLRDGGHTSLDWAIEASGPPSKDGKPLQHDSPIVVVLHGLMGCSDAMRSLCAEALAHGYRSVVFNKRGHGGMALATPKLQEFGSVDDLNQAIDRIQELYPASKLSSVGFSAGAGLLSSNLGKMGDAARLDVVVFSSSGFDAHSLFSQGGMHKVDDFLLTLARKNLLYRHEDQLASVIDVPHALRSSSIREFDERVALKMHGYNDHEAYWKNNNPTQGVANAARPALCVSASVHEGVDPVRLVRREPALDARRDRERQPLHVLRGTRVAQVLGERGRDAVPQRHPTVPAPNAIAGGR